MCYHTQQNTHVPNKAGIAMPGFIIYEENSSQNTSSQHVYTSNDYPKQYHKGMQADFYRATS